MKKKPNTFIRHLNLVALTAIISFLIIIIFILAVKYSPYLNSLKSNTFTCSMYHAEKDFDKWWEENKYKYNNITKDNFRKFPFPNGLIKSSAQIKEVDPDEIKIGDVIVFHVPAFNVNIGHRVIKKWSINDSYLFQAIGDNNVIPEIFNASQVVAKLTESKFFSFLEYDGCKEQGDTSYCKNKKQDLCSINELKHCCNINKTLQRSRCFYDFAINQTNPYLCCSIGEFYKDECYEQFALKTKEVRFCELIDKSATRYRECLFLLALETNNPVLCNRLKRYNAGCYNFPLNTTLCQSVLYDINYCYLTIADETDNLQLCDEILDENMKNECKISLAEKILTS